MNFGLTQQSAPPPSQQIVPFTVPETQLRLGVNGPGRIQKHQLICRKCHKPVEKTEQYGEQSGRRVIVCAYSCHGATGIIRVCEDQWGYDTRMLVLEGLPELCDNSGKPLMIADSKPVPQPKASKPGIIDIEAEVITDDLPPMRRLN